MQRAQSLHFGPTAGVEMLYFVRFIDKLSDLIGKASSYIYVIICAILSIEVFLRYGFDSPTIWAHETSGLIYVVAGILGGSYVLYHKGHVSVDILYNRLSSRAKAIMDLATSPLLLLICYTLVWYGWESTLRSITLLERSNTAWAPPVYPAKVIIYFGLVLFSFQVLAEIFRNAWMVIKGRQIA